MDNVLHYVSNLDLSTNEGINVSGSNTAALILNAVTTDGAIIEDLYLISRGTSEIKVNLFLSTASDYLRPNQGFYIGSQTTATTKGAVTNFVLPRVLAPVPQVGAEPFNRALYVGRGYALWAALESVTSIADGPNIGLQGGWY